jgi:pilus assembly protein Flp/PilA
MKKALELVRRLRSDEDGAALIEYTMLLGVGVVAVLGSIAIIRPWIADSWANLAAGI